MAMSVCQPWASDPWTHDIVYRRHWFCWYGVICSEFRWADHRIFFLLGGWSLSRYCRVPFRNLISQQQPLLHSLPHALCKKSRQLNPDFFHWGYCKCNCALCSLVLPSVLHAASKGPAGGSEAVLQGMCVLQSFQNKMWLSTAMCDMCETRTKSWVRLYRDRSPTNATQRSHVQPERPVVGRPIPWFQSPHRCIFSEYTARDFIY